MKKLFLKTGLILSLSAMALNFSACNNNKVKETQTEVSNELDSINAPDIDITPDSKLENDVEVAIKGFEGVRADVEDGVVILTGQISRDRLPALMKAVNDLKPKKVDNKLEIN
jgi:hypothetical protein